MAFTVRDYRDLVRLLAEHPEWQAELRRLLLADDFLALPAIVRDLAEAQRQSEARLTQVETSLTALAEAQQRTEARLEALVEAQQRTEARLEALAEAQRQSEARLTRVETSLAALAEAQRQSEARLTRVETSLAALAEAQRQSEARLTRVETSLAALAEAQRQSEARLTRVETSLAALAEAQQRTEARLEALVVQVQTLAEGQQRLVDTVGDLKGRVLESTYREHAAGYFGRWLKRARAVPLETLEETLETALSHEELLEVLRLDLLVQGRLRERPDAPELWLAVEVAAVLDEADVARAARRAALLRRAGYPALPMVAGEGLTRAAEATAREQQVAVMRDGQGLFWEEALAAWGPVA